MIHVAAKRAHDPGAALPRGPLAPGDAADRGPLGGEGRVAGAEAVTFHRRRRIGGILVVAMTDAYPYRSVAMLGETC